MSTQLAYSLSTPAGDSILDAEGRPDLWESLATGHSVRLAVWVASALDNGLEEVAAELVRKHSGLTLTIDRVTV